MSTRTNRILWMGAMVFPLYAMHLQTRISTDLSLLILPFQLILFVVLFVYLLYSEKSSLWNGFLAFVFWLPGLGLEWAYPHTESAWEGNAQTKITSILIVALAHCSIQFFGRLFINRFSTQASDFSNKERIVLGNKRFLWIGGAFLVVHILYVLLLTLEAVLADSIAIPAAVCFFVLFFSLLYVEKSYLWNGIIAFLFWMPVMGWWWALEYTEDTRLWDVFSVLFQIGLVHACFQVLGSMLITHYRRRKQINRERIEAETEWAADITALVQNPQVANEVDNDE